MNISSVNIKKVKLNEFEPYFSTIHDEYDKYLLNRVVGVAAASEGFPDLHIPLSNTTDSGDTFNSLEEWTARLSMAGSFVANQLPPLRQTSPSKKDKRNLSNKTHLGNAHPLHTIPGIFFDENFSLGNPHTFSAVCEYLDITGTNSDSFTTQKILQEKLSHYLDVVENHLMKEISAKSDSFFSALKNLQVLNSETSSCIQRITELQKRLVVLSKNHIRKGLEIVKLKRERGNYDLLLEGMSQNLKFSR